LQIQHAFGRRGVVGKRCQWLVHHADRVAVLAKNFGDTLPSGTVGEGAVDDDDEKMADLLQSSGSEL